MKSRISILLCLLAATLVVGACTVPSWINTAETDAEVAAPIAASLIDVIDPALAPTVTQVENGFNALIKTLDTYKASPTATNLQAVQSAFSAVNTNVSQLESAAQIKNSKTAATVTSVVQLLTQAIAEIAALVPAKLALAAAAPGSGAIGAVTPSLPASKHWRAHDLKREYNQIVKDDPRFKKLD